MWALLEKLLNTATALGGHVRAVQAFEEAHALYKAKEYRKCLPLMKESSDLGYIEAHTMLGIMYLFGYGVKENGEEGRRLLELAAQAGRLDAISTLGMVLVTGKGGAKIDMERGEALLQHAASLGDDQSRRMLEMIEKRQGMFRNLKRR